MLRSIFEKGRKLKEIIGNVEADITSSGHPLDQIEDKTFFDRVKNFMKGKEF